MQPEVKPSYHYNADWDQLFAGGCNAVTTRGISCTIIINLLEVWFIVIGK